MAEYLINLSGNICELLINHFFYSAFEKKFSKKTTVALSVLFTAFQFMNNNLFLGKSVLVMLGSTLFGFLVSLLYDVKWSSRFFYSILLLIILGAPEMIIGTVLTTVFGVDLSAQYASPVVFATGTLVSKFFAYAIVLVIRKRRFKIEGIVSKQNFFLLYILPAFSALVLLFFLKVCYSTDNADAQLMSLASSAVLTLANISIFYIIDKLNELIETKEKLDFAELHIHNQVLHYQELNKHQNELRIFRHDIKNRLLSLMALVKDGKSDKALQIMENNLNWLEEMNSNIINSGNPVVDAIIQAKLHIVKDKGITFQISTKLAEEIRIDELELGIVLGNALDNAIEAVEKNTAANKKRISLSLMSADGRISISVSNPVEAEINTERLSTAKPDKDKHGYGIKSIKAIAEKYEGIVLFTCDNGIFEANINLSNKKN